MFTAVPTIRAQCTVCTKISKGKVYGGSGAARFRCQNQHCVKYHKILSLSRNFSQLE